MVSLFQVAVEEMGFEIFCSHSQQHISSQFLHGILIFIRSIFIENISKSSFVD